MLLFLLACTPTGDKGGGVVRGAPGADTGDTGYADSASGETADSGARERGEYRGEHSGDSA